MFLFLLIASTTLAVVVFLIIASVTLAVAAAIDGASTVHFLGLGKGYTEANFLFGKNPSTLRVWLQGSLIIAAEIGVSWGLYAWNPIAGTIAGALMLVQSVFHFVFGYKNFQLK
jgi:hypothetical protein